MSPGRHVQDVLGTRTIGTYRTPWRPGPLILAGYHRRPRAAPRARGAQGPDAVPDGGRRPAQWAPAGQLRGLLGAPPRRRPRLPSLRNLLTPGIKVARPLERFIYVCSSVCPVRHTSLVIVFFVSQKNISHHTNSSLFFSISSSTARKRGKRMQQKLPLQENKQTKKRVFNKHSLQAKS